MSSSSLSTTRTGEVAGSPGDTSKYYAGRLVGSYLRGEENWGERRELVCGDAPAGEEALCLQLLAEQLVLH